MKFPQMLKKTLDKLWPALFWILCWAVAARLMNQPILLVSPVNAVVRFWEMAGTAAFWQSLAFSCGRILLGFALSVILSVSLAAAAHRFAVVRRLLSPLTLTVKAVPVASFVVVVLFWTSSRNLSIIISMMIGFPLIYQNTLSELDHLSKELLELGQLFRLSRPKRLHYLILPQLLPTLKASLSVALGMCFKSGIAAEIIGIPRGSVGEGLYEAKIYLNSAELFAWTLAIVLMTLLCETVLKGLFKLLERSCQRCRKSKT